MQRSVNKNEKGITLIALVVTIVVLLILAGVSLSLVLGENGLINKSKEARDKYAEATKNEQSELNKVDEWIEENIGGDPGGGTVGDVTIPEGYYYVGGTKDSGIVISDAVEDKEKYKGQTFRRKPMGMGASRNTKFNVCNSNRANSNNRRYYKCSNWSNNK